MRNVVFRADGKMVNVHRRQGQLLVCTGCCCGHTERGHAAVPQDLYHNEWERRRLRNRVHLTIGGCLGPCALANVVELIFDGHTIFFQSVNDEATVLQIYAYLEQMLAADSYLPPPPALAALQFTAFQWESRPDGAQVEDRRRAPKDAAPGFLFLTHADTDLLTLRAAAERLPEGFPPVQAYNLLNLRTDADVDAFLDAQLPAAEIVVVRVHGGRDSFRHGFDRLAAEAEARGIWLICVPGTNELDPDLTAISNTGVPVTHELAAYLHCGGAANMEHALRFLSDHLLTTGYGYDAPAEQPRHGVYHPRVPSGTLDEWRAVHDLTRPAAGVLFYRSHLLSGNTAFVDAIVAAGDRAGINVLPVYAYSLKDADDGPEAMPGALRYFAAPDGVAVDAIICTLSFALGGVNPDGPTEAGWGVEVLERLDVPVFQAITVSSARAQWAASQRGLSPVDAAMNVVLPEFDGRIGGVPVSFKEAMPAIEGSRDLGAPVVGYLPDPERIEQLMRMVAGVVRLRRTPNAEKRVAFVLTNSTARISRIGNAVGLDAPASLMRLLEAMREAGYAIGDLPPNGDALLHALIERCSYDVEVLTDAQLRNAAGRVPVDEYGDWFAALPGRMQGEISGQWGAPPGVAYVHDGHIALAGLAFGNAFVALQPPRGYGMDPNAIYHMPDLPPPHSYHALYRWLRDPDGWGADAIVHVGKHGTLEWLPGKAVAPSETCYPDQFLAGLPLIYPFIINDPGEGAQAKRRAHAVIVDHMTPPMTAAGSYGDLAELAQLVDEYYQMEMLDPAKVPVLQRQIWDLIVRANLDSDMQTLLNRNVNPEHAHDWDPTLTDEGAPASMEEMVGKDIAHLIQEVDGYLCELAGAQIRDGLHILGQAPEGEQLVELLFQLVRLPNLEVPSLRESVARAWGWEVRELAEDLGGKAAPTPDPSPADAGEGSQAQAESPASGVVEIWHPRPAEAPLSRPGGGGVGGGGSSALVTRADALEFVDGRCRALLTSIAEPGFDIAAAEQAIGTNLAGAPRIAEARGDVTAVLRFVCEVLAPRLRQTDEEIGAILHALDGGYVPAGPSGAPTRGMAHVLPTGRNFYALDPRAMPSAASWRVGQDLAEALLRRYVEDEGGYPETVGISIWGTSAMRTHGDDIAEVFALLGVRPRWQAENHRLLGVEVVSLEELGRPRVDVVCRISGFFRDAFPGVIAALDDAVQIVAALDEPAEQNFVRKHAAAQQARYEADGVEREEAMRRARYRVFGCKPGTYGAGILPLIDERKWESVADFAEAYVNWGGYAYTAGDYGVDARRDFEVQLSGVQVAAKNQDNREHDIFDSDDYLQYHGGMIATIRALTGRTPRRYFGDSSDPSRPKVRDLKEEALRVFRSRVVNPKWIDSMKRHGYKGALELAATVDYLFGYDATADVLDDWVYERLAQSYLFDESVRDFLDRSNPWAMKDMAGRMLEAIERGMWESPSAEMRAGIEAAYLRVDGVIEHRGGAPVAGANVRGA